LYYRRGLAKEAHGDAEGALQDLKRSRELNKSPDAAFLAAVKRVTAKARIEQRATDQVWCEAPRICRSFSTLTVAPTACVGKANFLSESFRQSARMIAPVTSRVLRASNRWILKICYDGPRLTWREKVNGFMDDHWMEVCYAYRFYARSKKLGCSNSSGVRHPHTIGSWTTGARRRALLRDAARLAHDVALRRCYSTCYSIVL
jgi:hypothetical protein